MGTKIHGLGAIVYLAPGTGAAVEITEAGEFTIDVDYDTAALFAFGETWETVLKGISRWSGTMSGNYDEAQITAWSAAIGTAASAWYLYPAKATATNYYYGSIWPKLSVTVPSTGGATFSCSFQGDGALSLKP